MLDTIVVNPNVPLFFPLSPGKRKLTEALRIWIRDGELSRFEVSLPRLLFGHNGRCLETQEHIDEALSRCASELGKICMMPPPEGWLPWRIDIAWNFDFGKPTREIIVPHHVLRVPGIQKAGDLKPGDYGVSWRGARSRFVVTIYDKAEQMRIKCDRPVLRAEVSLRGKVLAEKLRKCCWNKFDDIYLKTYRPIMASIPPIKCGKEQCENFTDTIAFEDAATRRRILSRLSHRRSYSKWTKECELMAAQVRLGEFGWETKLPDGTPPPPVTVEPTAKARGQVGQSS